MGTSRGKTKTSHMASIILTNILPDYLQPIKQYHRAIMIVHLSQQHETDFLMVSAYGRERSENLELPAHNEGIDVH